MKTLISYMIFFGLLIVMPVKAQIYLNPDAPYEERVADLLPRMTLSEKLSYIGGYNSFYILNIDRLDIPAIKMSDGPVGVRNYGNTTAYPAGVLMAASWDTTLIRNVGHALGKDARARGVHILLAPGMNIYRIPINGRNFEYFGEDPHLASEIASDYITGLQSEGVIGTAKHFAANSFERNRFNVSAQIDERTLQEIYYPAFRACVEKADVGAIMSAYNKINGIWCSHNDYLLNQTLKTDWNFDGFVMSDWGATHNALAAAVGGLDLEMPSGAYMNSTNLMPYITNGTLSESVIDEKVRRILSSLFRFGFFDRDQTLGSIPLDNPETAEVSLNAARGGIVLLKNNSILPLLRDTIQSIAVIGDLADAYVAGGGSSYTSPFHTISVYEGVDSLVGETIDVFYSPATLDMDSAYQNSVFYTDTISMEPGLEADYYNNMTLSGSPAYSGIDEHINFYWSGEPGIPGIGADNFSIRWSGYIIPPVDGNYIFSVASDDGFRLYINDTVFMEDWTDHATRISNERAYLYTGINYHIVLEYYENGGIAEIRMGYQNAGTVGQEAVQLAADADVAVVCVGYGSNNEGEGWDRSFDLPDLQADFIEAVADVNENTIIVLFAGGAVQTSPWLDRVRGFIHAFYPGQYGGYALAELLFGDLNPGGKLPFSFDAAWENNPAYNDYTASGSYESMPYSEGIFVGYRYYDTTSTVSPLYPFGFGLSYTSFEYDNLLLVPDDESDFTSLSVSFDITNSGAMAGSEIAQLYIHDLESEEVRPVKELKAFKKVWLEPAETQTINMNLDLRAFKYFKESVGEWEFEPGDFEILIGASSQDIRLRDTLTLTDEMVMPEVIRLYPPDDAKFAELEPDYSVTFSREMNCVGLVLYIRKYSDNNVVDTLNSSDFNGCGTRTITFHSDRFLDPLTEYYIIIPEGFFTDGSGNDITGYSTKDDWNFKTFIEPATGIENIDNSSDLYLYPNPAKHKLNIFLKEGLNNVRLELNDLDGTLIYNDILTGYSLRYEMDISAIPPGAYILRIINEEVTYSEKLIVL